MLTIETLLKLMIESNASDLFISVGAYPMLKIEGEMIRLKEVEITQDIMQEIHYSLLNEEQKQIFNSEKELDFSYSYAGLPLL
jgi:Tfp pilus assembly pilus retraction ATPase PilT